MRTMASHALMCTRALGASGAIKGALRSRLVDGMRRRHASTVASLQPRIADIMTSGKPGDSVTVMGWVRSVRAQKAATFVELNDGSSLRGCQVVLEARDTPGMATGSCIKVTGKLVGKQWPISSGCTVLVFEVASIGSRQSNEVQGETVHVLGASDGTYPLQKKRHTLEYLRDIGHLRPRTNTQGAVLRARNAIASAVHEFFQQNNFVHVHTPILTGNDCEGAGELFKVAPTGDVRPGDDFFGRPVYLTVSGQLHAEIIAAAVGRAYTFGPTFRAEDSKTSRHLSEFQMVEAEIAFAGSHVAMDVAEGCVRHAGRAFASRCADDLAFFVERINPKLKEVFGTLDRPFARISYKEAMAVLKAHTDAQATKGRQAFDKPVEWGIDLGAEHERFIAETHVGGPTFITDYPASIKPFYMLDNGDGTVASFDLVVPEIGELVGGSAREDRLDVLMERLRELGPQAVADLSWYADLRRYGSFPHAGFGVGFERLVRLLTGMENIRDVAPFPRHPGTCAF